MKKFLFFFLIISLQLFLYDCHKPTPAPHKDFDPVIEFPSADPNYKERERGNKTETIEEATHQMLHFNTVNAIIHKNIDVHKKLKDMQRKIRNGDFLG